MRLALFIRNVRARDQLELFLIAAVSSLLLLRFYLYLTHYPQVGGGNLHIAHMLYGGLLMGAAIILNLAFLGARLQRLTALTGGIGFGIFIDEIGKFLTKDNNYFFRPAVGIIYAVFVVLYLLINFLGRQERLSGRDYQLNALAQLEEAVLADMDPAEQARVAELLARADPASPLTRQLQLLLRNVETVEPAGPNRLERLRQRIDSLYSRWARSQASNGTVRGFFGALAVISILAIGLTIYDNIQDVIEFLGGQADYGHGLVIGQLLATTLATGLVIRGLLRLTAKRRQAFELFRRATLVNLLLTEFFIFSRIQFGAMAGFIGNLLLLLLINFVIAQEERQARQIDAIDQIGKLS